MNIIKKKLNFTENFILKKMIKKLSTLLLLLTVSFSSYGQYNKTYTKHAEYQMPAGFQSNKTAVTYSDTLAAGTECANPAPTTYSAGADGYVTGTTNAIDFGSGFVAYITSTAQGFTLNGTGTLQEVYTWWGDKTVVGTNDDFAVTVYDGGFGSGPVNVLATLPLNTANINAGANFTTGFLTNLYDFTSLSTPVTVTDSFFVGFSYNVPSASTNDTCVLVCTGAAGNCNNSLNSVHQLLDDNAGFTTWIPASGIWQSFNVELFVWAILERDSTTSSLKSGSITEYGVYPNPTCNNATVRFDLNKSSDIQFLMINMAGQTIKNETYSNLNGGYNEIKLDLTTIPTGTYLYKVISNDGSITSKLIVNK